jgi:hypothetical protein
MVYDSKVCYVFNKFYSAFIKSIKATNTELKAVIKKHYKVIDKSSEQYYDAFWENVSPYWKTFVDVGKLYESADLLQVCLATEMNVEAIFSPLNDEDKERLANYVNILLLFGYLYTELKKEKDTETSSSNDGEGANIQIDAEDKVEDDVEAEADLEPEEELNETEQVTENAKLANNVLELLRLIQAEKKDTPEYKELLEEIIDDDVTRLLSKVTSVSQTVETENFTSSNNNGLPSFDILQSLENSKIANLAKEITSEIDLSKLSIDKPEDISKLMDMSGDNNFLGNIVSKVSSKLTEKLSNGELKQEELMNEAMSVMGALNGNDGIGSLLKNMGGLGGLGDIMSNPMMAEMLKMAKKGKVQTKNTNGARRGSGASTRDRLRKKLDERKKNAEQQEQ